MNVSQRFARQIIANKAYSEESVAFSQYRREDTLTDGRRIVATFIDANKQGVENPSPRSEMRIIVYPSSRNPTGFCAEECGLKGEFETFEIFERGEWVRVPSTKSTLELYSRKLKECLPDYSSLQMAA